MTDMLEQVARAIRGDLERSLTLREQELLGFDGWHCTSATKAAIETVRDCLGVDPSHEPPKGAFDKEPPSWARDEFNGDMAARCGRCGAWCSVVRPGKTQCDNCHEGENLAALFHAALEGKE